MAEIFSELITSKGLALLPKVRLGRLVKIYYQPLTFDTVNIGGINLNFGIWWNSQLQTA